MTQMFILFSQAEVLRGAEQTTKNWLRLTMTTNSAHSNPFTHNLLTHFWCRVEIKYDAHPEVKQVLDQKTVQPKLKGKVFFKKSTGLENVTRRCANKCMKSVWTFLLSFRLKDKKITHSMFIQSSAGGSCLCLAKALSLSVTLVKGLFKTLQSYFGLLLVDSAPHPSRHLINHNEWRM